VVPEYIIILKIRINMCPSAWLSNFLPINQT
jgi:hypothetical protein